MALVVVPNPGQTLNVTRGPIRNNFGFINAGFLQDHKELNSGADSGKHNQSTYLKQPADPVIADGSTDTIIYSTDDGSGNTVLYASYLNALGVQQYYPVTGAIKDPAGVRSGCQLPSGIIMNWGLAQTLALPAANVTITWAIPFTNALPTVTTTIAALHGATDYDLFVEAQMPGLLNFTGATFRAGVAIGVIKFYYFAIGF